MFDILVKHQLNNCLDTIQIYIQRIVNAPYIYGDFCEFTKEFSIIIPPYTLFCRDIFVATNLSTALTFSMSDTGPTGYGRQHPGVGHHPMIMLPGNMIHTITMCVLGANEL